MNELNVEYRGFDIALTKGLEQVWFSIFRKSDGLEIVSDYTFDETPISEQAEWLKVRVDKLIESNGASEQLEDDF